MAAAGARCFLARTCHFRQFSCVSRPDQLFRRHSVELCNALHKRQLSKHVYQPYPQVESEEAARAAVMSLNDGSRELLMQELRRLDNEPSPDHPATIKSVQLWDVLVFNAVPFIGFGLLDNLIMILAGEYIEVKFGAVLGISTMAAAALGNLISDVAGVGAGGYIEMIGDKMGIRRPDLTAAQTNLWQTRWIMGLGRALGVALGCLLGMFPLLLFKRDEEETQKTLSQETGTQAKL